jgi:hypothetical protein
MIVQKRNKKTDVYTILYPWALLVKKRNLYSKSEVWCLKITFLEWQEVQNSNGQLKLFPELWINLTILDKNKV